MAAVYMIYFGVHAINKSKHGEPANPIKEKELYVVQDKELIINALYLDSNQLTKINPDACPETGHESIAYCPFIETLFPLAEWKDCTENKPFDLLCRPPPFRY